MKSGFVVLVGRSNVGKSTLLNTLVGTKIAATSFRAQMTRHEIHGVMNTPEGQAIFIDTPGVFKDRKNPLTAKLTNKVRSILEQELDLIIYVVDPTREIGDEEQAMLGMVKYLDIPKLLVINKSDLSPRERKHQGDYEMWEDDFDQIFKLSALRGSHIQPLREKVMEILPEGEEMYGEGQLTNIDNYFWIEEIIREKVFSIFDKEVPYSITVKVEKVQEKSDLFVIEAKILTNADRYKRIIIGQKGHKIKEIGQLARKELEQAINKKIFLELEVEVDKHWVERV
ncbi:MAG: GTPase Era [Candidatus Magasanikbacteria bacterium]